jgi:hypothetical protein
LSVWAFRGLNKEEITKAAVKKKGMRFIVINNLALKKVAAAFSPSHELRLNL